MLCRTGLAVCSGRYHEAGGVRGLSAPMPQGVFDAGYPVDADPALQTPSNIRTLIGSRAIPDGSLSVRCFPLSQ